VLGLPFTIQENVAWDHIAVTPKHSRLSRIRTPIWFGSLAQRANIQAIQFNKLIAAVTADALRVLTSFGSSFIPVLLLKNRPGWQMCQLNDDELPNSGKHRFTSLIGRRNRWETGRNYRLAIVALPAVRTQLIDPKG